MKARTQSLQFKEPKTRSNMKKFLLLFAIIIVKNCVAQPSNSNKNDTLCLPAEKVEALVIAAQQGKLLNKEVNILTQRISEKEDIIKWLKDIGKIDSLTIISYEKEIRVMKDQRGIYDMELKVLNKSLKKQKRKTFWTAMAGVASTTAAIFLFK